MADSMMENVGLPFLPAICKTHSSLFDVQNLLNIADENRFFSNKNPGKLQDVISHVHVCLNSSKQRGEGLIVLNKVLQQCVTEVFTQHAVTWIKFMIQIFQSHDGATTQKLTCHVCSRIINTVSGFTSLSRDVAALIPQILTPLISASLEWRKEAFMCINACITNYPGPCGSFKGKIDAVVAEELNSDSVSEECFRCYGLLSCCGGGGNQGIKHSEEWTVQCGRAMVSLHSIVDKLYEGLDTNFKSKHGEDTLPIGDIPNCYPDRYQVLVTRLGSRADCLKTLLSENFPAKIKLPVQDMLNILCKVLSINCKMLINRPSTERLQLCALIPVIHKTMINTVLTSLIKCCKQHLLPYSKLIVSLLVQGLSWSHATSPYGQEKPYGALRCSLYNCLSLWLQTTGSLVETSTEETVLTREIIHDAQTQTDTLQVTGSLRKNEGPPPSKKKKRSGYQEISHGISSQRKIDITANSSLTSSALNCLYWLITTVGTQMKENTLQNVLEFTISTCMAVCQRNTDTGIPYWDPKCRLNLLRVLQACTIVPHPSLVSPLQCAIGIFRCARQDGDIQVSSFCIEAQQVLEILIHPRAPCLKAPVIIDKVIHIGQTDKRGECQENGINSTESTDDISNILQQPTQQFPPPSQTFNGSHTDSNKTNFKSFFTPSDIENSALPIKETQTVILTEDNSKEAGESETMETSSHVASTSYLGNDLTSGAVSVQEMVGNVTETGEDSALLPTGSQEVTSVSPDEDSSLFSQSGNENIQSIDLDTIDDIDEGQGHTETKQHDDTANHDGDFILENHDQGMEDMLASFKDADPDSEK